MIDWWFPDFCQECGVKFDSFIGNVPYCGPCILELNDGILAAEDKDAPDPEVLEQEKRSAEAKYNDLVNAIEADISCFEKGSITVMELYKRVKFLVD